MKANKRIAVVVALTSVLVIGMKLSLLAQNERESGMYRYAPAIVQNWMAPAAGSGGGGGRTQAGAELYQYAWTTDSSYESLWKFYANKIGNLEDRPIAFTQAGGQSNSGGGITNVLSETHRQSMFCKQSKDYIVSVVLSQVKGDKPVVMLSITGR